MDDSTTVEETKTSEETQGSAPSQEKPKRTEEETTVYNLKKQVERAKELGLDPADLLGLKPKQIKVDETLPDDTPLTIGTLKELRKVEAQKSALQMADEIHDETEREEVKRLLMTRLVPSGNATSDFVLARNAVNAERAKRITDEVARKVTTEKTAAGSSQPGNTGDDFIPTPVELVFMRPPYNVPKDKILALRKRQ